MCGECSNDELPFGSDSSDSSDSDSSSSSPSFDASAFGGDRVDRTQPGGFTGWSDRDDGQWICHSKNQQDVYINMALNPEGYTGYEGEEPHRIWRAIYEENCFVSSNGGGGGKNEQGNEQAAAAAAAAAVAATPGGGGGGLMRPSSFQSMCLEQRVFYRLFSGLHASISTHISNNYPIGTVDPMVDLHSPENCGLIGPNITQYQNRLGNHPDRLENLYFAFVFMLRAVNKASDTLRAYNYTTTNGARDLALSDLIDETLSSPLVSSCSSAASFDEASMFSSSKGPHLKEQLRAAFRNISRIMDCVGCEKCRLHGKLQILGLGTAIKILFEKPKALQPDHQFLERNEIMALITTLAKFSHALHVVHEFQARVAEAERGALLQPQTVLPLAIAVVLGAIGVILYGLRCIVRRRHSSGAGSTAIIAAAATIRKASSDRHKTSRSSTTREEIKSTEQ